MHSAFLFLAVLTVVSAIGALFLRNLVHCALSLMVALAGLAALFLQLGAQFVGFAQILVYIGAVAILIVFAILLTRGGEAPQPVLLSRSWPMGFLAALLVLGCLVGAIVTGFGSKPAQNAKLVGSAATVQSIGDKLMTDYVLPLEIAGLLLTAALIGAVIIAAPEGLQEGARNKQTQS